MLYLVKIFKKRRNMNLTVKVEVAEVEVEVFEALDALETVDVGATIPPLTQVE